MLDVWQQASGGTGWFPGHEPANAELGRRTYRAWADALKAAGVRHVPLHGARGYAPDDQLSHSIDMTIKV